MELFVIYSIGVFSSMVATFFEVYFESRILMEKLEDREEYLPNMIDLFWLGLACLFSWFWFTVPLLFSMLNFQEFKRLKNK